MHATPPKGRVLAAANRHRPQREPALAQIASFVDLFVWLLVLKSFFLPLFIIPTGSMAETLRGEHGDHTCPNCGIEYAVGFLTPAGPDVIECPNCRFREATMRSDPRGVRLARKAGDRIVVHGWPYELGGAFGPRRWDVVVFKNPNEPDVNYIKRLIGLPGETIEIIDGDVYVQEADENELHIARKTRHAQQSLWFPYYNHDYPPRQAVRGPRNEVYHPRWTTLIGGTAWSGLETRTPRFGGPTAPRAEIQFVTGPPGDLAPGLITDVYGYNGYEREHAASQPILVSDVRLGVDVQIEAGDGYVELSLTKFADRFAARLHADGRVTLEHRGVEEANESWGEARVRLPPRPVRFSLGHADYQAVVEVDERPLLATTPEQYSVTPALARRQSAQDKPATLRIAAERVRAQLSHLRIERDVYYTSRPFTFSRRPGNGTQGNPIEIPKEAYFVLGDNSPSSLDARYWSAMNDANREVWMLGPHLRAAYQEGKYAVGTVPADQMIGCAFLVYWPGFLPHPWAEYLPERLRRLSNLLPDLGRVRWIH